MLVDRLIPRETRLLGEPSHRLNELIDLRTQQSLPVARLNGFNPIVGVEIPVFDRDLICRSMDRQPQIVDLTANDEVQRIDRRVKERTVLV